MRRDVAIVCLLAVTPALGQVFEVVAERNAVDLDVAGQEAVTVRLFVDTRAVDHAPWQSFHGWNYYTGLLAAEGGAFELPVESANHTAGDAWFGRRPPATLPGPGGANGGFRTFTQGYTLTDGASADPATLAGFDSVLSGPSAGVGFEGIQAQTIVGGYNQDTSDRLEVFRAELIFDTPGVHTVRFHPLDASFFTSPAFATTKIGMQAWMSTVDATVVVEIEQPLIAAMSGNRDPVVHGKRIRITIDELIDIPGDVARVRFFRDSNHNDRLDNDDEFLGKDGIAADGWSYSALSDAGWGTATTGFFAVAVDAKGNRSLPFSMSADVLETGVPYIRSFSSIAPTINPQSTLSLRAAGVTDADGGVRKVRFFRDANPDGKLGGGDEMIGVVRDLADPLVTFEPQWQADWGTGTVRFHAQAVDDADNKSLTKSVDVVYDPFVRMPMLSLCPADRTADGFVGVADLADYLNAYVAADPSADIDANGIVDQDDLITFIQMWNRGCD